MKIIIPTDFSDLSKIAVNYAAGFASATGNPMILISNVSIEAMPRAAVLVHLEEKMETAAMEDLREIASQIRQDINPAPDLFFEITRETDAARGILDTAAQQNAGLIVMGTRGASGLTGAFLGSVSSEVIRKSNIPVLVIPAEAKYQKGGVALMAINPESTPPDQILAKFSDFCSKGGFTPEFLAAGYNGNESIIADLKARLHSLFGNADIKLHTRPEKEPENAMQALMETNPFKIFAIDPGQHSFFERITGKSVTTRVIANSTVPVLTLA